MDDNYDIDSNNNRDHLSISGEITKNTGKPSNTITAIKKLDHNGDSTYTQISLYVLYLLTLCLFLGFLLLALRKFLRKDGWALVPLQEPDESTENMNRICIIYKTFCFIIQSYKYNFK